MLNVHIPQSRALSALEKQTKQDEMVWYRPFVFELFSAALILRADVINVNLDGVISNIDLRYRFSIILVWYTSRQTDGEVAPTLSPGLIASTRATAWSLKFRKRHR